jgi:hypothetical protein
MKHIPMSLQGTSMVYPLFPDYNDHFIRFPHLHFINIRCAFYMFERFGLLCLRQCKLRRQSGFSRNRGVLGGVTANRSSAQIRVK